MRLEISMFIGLYCVWQIKSSETSIPTTMITQREQENEGKDFSGRDKEILLPPPLVSPYGGTLKLLMGIAVPIAMSGGRILVFGQNFQFQFPMPQNATFFTNYFDDSTTRGRLRRAMTTSGQRPCRNVTGKPDNSRSIFYRSLVLAFERHGASGKDCLMRSICEAAETPLKDEGLIGELLHRILTPDHGDGTEFITPDDVDYFRAAQAGRSGNNCSLIYPSCPMGLGLLDRITRIDYT